MRTVYEKVMVQEGTDAYDELVDRAGTLADLIVD